MNYYMSLALLKIWFLNYKGPGKIQFKGFAEVNEAEEILKKAGEYYQHTATKNHAD